MSHNYTLPFVIYIRKNRTLPADRKNDIIQLKLVLKAEQKFTTKTLFNGQN